MTSGSVLWWHHLLTAWQKTDRTQSRPWGIPQVIRQDRIILNWAHRWQQDFKKSKIYSNLTAIKDNTGHDTTLFGKVCLICFVKTKVKYSKRFMNTKEKIHPEINKHRKVRWRNLQTFVFLVWFNESLTEAVREREITQLQPSAWTCPTWTKLKYSCEWINDYDC